jgi:hypothetical protein
MKDQRRFAPKGGRIESELVAGFIGISTYVVENFKCGFYSRKVGSSG